MSDPEADSLRSTFPSYMAEGERLYLCGEFSKAAHSFSNVSRESGSEPTHYPSLLIPDNTEVPHGTRRTLLFLLFICS